MVEHLDKLSTVEIVWWSALHPHPAFHVARVLPSAASHAYRVSCEVRGRASATPEQVALCRRFRTPVALSRVGDSKSVDLLQGERAGRNDVRENGVVQAVDDSSDDHETGVAEPELRQSRRKRTRGKPNPS